jgi:hypothetical protein
LITTVLEVGLLLALVAYWLWRRHDEAQVMRNTREMVAAISAGQVSINDVRAARATVPSHRLVTLADVLNERDFRERLTRARDAKVPDFRIREGEPP